MISIVQNKLLVQNKAAKNVNFTFGDEALSESLKCENYRGFSNLCIAKGQYKKNIKEPRIFPDHNIQELLKQSRKFFGKVSDGPFCGKKLQRFPQRLLFVTSLIHNHRKKGEWCICECLGVSLDQRLTILLRFLKFFFE